MSGLAIKSKIYAQTNISLNCMTYRSVVPLLFFMSLAVCFPGASRAAEMLIEAAPSRLYEGEPIAYRITVASETRIPDDVLPEFETTDDFRFEYRGRQDQSRQSVSIINGKTMQTTLHIAQFGYEIFPKRAGSLVLGSPKIVLDGRPLRPSRLTLDGRRRNPGADDTLTFEVKGQDRQDVIALELRTDRTSVYPLQPVTATLVVHVKALPGSEEKNPLGFLREAPTLSIPWVETGSLPGGVRPLLDRENWLGPLETDAGGFAVNDLLRRDGFSSRDFGIGSITFGLPGISPRRFAFPAKRVRRPNADGVETDYWEYTLARRFLAERPGRFTLDAVSVKGTFAVTDPGANQPRGETIYAISGPLEIAVRDVPLEGRPKSYIGAFGTFDWTVDLQPRKAHVGEPLTLTFTLSGRGSTSDVKAPDLAGYEEISSLFRIFAPTEQVDADRCVFTYTIRPISAGMLVFPAVEMAYFDVETERFVTKTSEPITIEVAVTETLNENAIHGLVSPSREMSRGGLFANKPSPGGVLESAFTPLRGTVLIVLPAGLYLGLVFGLYLHRRSGNDFSGKRRRAAVPKARRRLESIRSDSRAAAGEIVSAVQGLLNSLVLELLDLPEGGHTTADLCRLLEEAGFSSACLEEVRRLLEKLDAARFGGFSIPQAPELLDAAERICDRIAREPVIRSRKTSAFGLKKAGSSEQALFFLATSLPASLLLATLSGCAVRSDPENLRLFAQAQEIFDAAASAPNKTEEFEKAALLYERLLENGVRSGAVYYNLGNARAQAGKRSQAIAAYRRAGRLMPLDEHLRANLRAVAGKDDNVFPVPSIMYLFFWQNLLGYRMKFAITALLAWSAFVFAAVGLFRFRKAMRRLVLLFAASAAIMGCSVLYDVYRYEFIRYAVVAGEGAVPRKGNSLHYTPSFTSPVSEGTEAIVRERRGNWVLLRFADGQDGWLRDEELVFY